jgi:hypothetical protein
MQDQIEAIAETLARLKGAVQANPYLRHMQAAYTGIGSRFPFLQAYYGEGTYDVDWATRQQLVRAFSWAIPDERALSLIAKHGPIVEIGAGLGYWAALLEARGVEVVAYDDGSWNELLKIGNPYRYWTEVLTGSHEVLSRHQDHTLFLCWPPFDTEMAADALAAYEGDTLIYIGEGEGGCTGTKAFFAHLEEGRRGPEEIHRLPRYMGMRDALYIYRRLE